MRGDGLIVVIAFFHRLPIHDFREQQMRQHSIGLLAYLMMVQKQRMIMQKQRKLFLRNVRKIHLLFMKERIILRADTQALIPREIHLPSASLHFRDLRFRDAGLLFCFTGKPQIPETAIDPRHGIGLWKKSDFFHYNNLTAFRQAPTRK